MPLKTGHSKEVVCENVADLIAAGYPLAKAVAVAYAAARRESGIDQQEELSAGQGDSQAQVAFIVYTDGDRVLWMRRQDGSWSFPGGGVESGETAMQGAIRESLEETQHAPVSGLALLLEDGRACVYGCEDGRFDPVLNDEHLGYVWASVADAPDPLFPEPAVPLPVKTAALDRREYDTNGWFKVEDNPLSKVGVFQYLGKSIDPELEPERLYGVFRPPEELANPETIESFKLLPWIDEHVMLGSEDEGLMPAERKGIQGVTGENVWFDEATGYLRANIKVMSETLAGQIAAGKKELSCGYRCTYEAAEGIWNGQPYQFIQRNLRGNHLALVDSGRMGPDVAVLDRSETEKEPPVAEPTNEEKEGAGEAKGMTLEDAVASLEKIMPFIGEIQKMLGAGAAPAAMADKDMDGEAEDDDEEKPGAQDPKSGTGAKARESMDAADIARQVEARLTERRALYESVSAHVGAFDHADMTIAQMADYGIQKLGLANAPKSGRLTFLRGYLAAKGAPSKETAKPAMDGKGGSGNFIDRHLAGTKE